MRRRSRFYAIVRDPRRDKATLPALKRSDIGIVDNLGGHKGKAVRTLIRAGAAVLPL